MSMLDLTKAELNRVGALSGDLPPILLRITESISNPTIPFRMKLAIGVSEMVLYASQFRRNIAHWDGGYIPINAITWILSASGDGKDSSINAARKCFETGYDMIADKRKAIAHDTAKDKAQQAGLDMHTEWEVYKEFYRAPNPLFVAPSTSEGFIQHLNDLDSDGLGAGHMFSGEIATELANSSIIIDNLKVISELYDVGKKEVKVLKARENQSKEITGLPVNAMFAGSQAAILFDESIKQKFKTEFSSKQARRSIFFFNSDVIVEPDFPTIEQMIAYEERLEDEAVSARQKVSQGISVITEYSLAHAGQPLAVSPAVRKLFITYKRYNKELASTMSKVHPISILVRTHLQWKAFKISGAIAMFNQHEQIQLSDYIEAIRFCELMDHDMEAFETELVKEQYELFTSYMRNIAENNKAEVSLHSLRKLGYIPTSGTAATKMKELTHLSNSYDKHGIYTVCDAGICFEDITPTPTSAISFKPIDNSVVFNAIANNLGKDAIRNAKAHVAQSAKDGYEYHELEFSELADLLKGDFAYSPFKFKDGIRTNENLESGTKWIVLDIDDSTITASEAHFMLGDINHHIALTSDKDNEFKFRILIELESFVELDPMTWRHFIASIASSLALKADLVAQSQIIFSYSGREVLSVTDGSPLEVKDHLVTAAEKVAAKPSADKPLPKGQKLALLNDELTTFAAAFEAKSGEGSRKLIWAAKYAFHDLDMPRDEVIALIHRINNYWTYQMDESRLEQTILSQIERW